MKNKLSQTVFMTGVLLLGWAAPACAVDNIAVTGLEGKAQILRGGQAIEASADQKLQAGDVIRTGADTTIDVSVNNVAGYRVLPGSESEIVSGEQGQMQIKIINGRVIVNVDRLPAKSSFEVQTPTAIAAVRGTQFLGQVDLLAPGNANSSFAVREGTVDVLSVASGQTLTLNEGFAADIPQNLSGPFQTRQAFGSELAVLDQASTVRTCA